MALVRLLPLLVLFAGSPAARAAPASDAAARALAKKHNNAARKLFHLGRFEEAAAEYVKAYDARPVPEFLHNIAQCHQRIGDAAHLERALFYFESYLRAAPDAKNRAAVEETMAEVRARLSKLRAASRPPRPAPASRTVASAPAAALSTVPAPTTAAARPAPTPLYRRWWFWTVIGVAVAGATATGLAVGLRPGEASPATGSMPPGQVRLELRGR